jgi:hypothetical protein
MSENYADKPKVLDPMTPCGCGHPLWCHATHTNNPDPDGIVDGKPYVLGEPDECNHIGPGGWDCDCEVYGISSRLEDWHLDGFHDDESDAECNFCRQLFTSTHDEAVAEAESRDDLWVL